MNQKQAIEIKSQSFKFHFLIALTALLFLVLLLRLVSLQVYQGEKLKSFSDSNRFNKQLLHAPRGLILDRYGQILAGNKKMAQLVLHLNSDSLPEQSLKQIVDIIQTPLIKLKAIIKKSVNRNGSFHPVILKNHLSMIEIHKLKQLSWIHAEAQVREMKQRFYPLRENGSHMLGFIGAISKKEIQEFKKHKRVFPLDDIIGKSGLEKHYNDELKGQNGFSMIEVDAQNQISGKNSFHPLNFLKIEPKKGKDLTLTIDKNLQLLAQQAMNKGNVFDPKTGAVIVMKTNGEILTMLSVPGFDPNTISSNIDLAVWKKWSTKGSKMFINKGLQEHYSPGSVFKPFVALAALEEGIISPDQLLETPATFKVGQKIYHDHNPRGHGKINVVTAIEKSANTFFYQIADQLGIEKIYNYARLFGFGKKTQIEMLGESPGFFPSPAWKQHNLKDQWRRGDTINISIGQGEVLVTLLQLTVAYNAIATQGLIVRPFVVKKNPDESIREPVILDILTDRIQRKHFSIIKKGLKQVVEGQHGTARWYRIPSLSFSGKTGTAQVISLTSQNLYKKCRLLPKKHRHHGWFISFAPSDTPEIVVSVFTEHSCSGSKGAAPIAKEIIQHYFAQKNGIDK